MTLLQLQYFETLARVLHYTRAAEELHIAQPSLSYSIGELEKELGVKLFEKENTLITKIIEEIYKAPENKNIRFQFIEDNSFDISTMLKSEKLDFAFTTTRNDWAESITVMKQPLYLAVPLEHPLAKLPSVTFTDFLNEPLIVLDKGTSLRTQFDQAFKERGAIPNIVFEVHECNAALQYVALNVRNLIVEKFAISTI